jgi:hypothetical protein
MAIVVGFGAFLGSLIVWRHAIPGGILFYQGIVCSAFGSLLTLWLGLRQAKRFQIVHLKDTALVFLAGYALMFTVPTTVERSYSVKLLEELATRGSMTNTELLSWIEAHWRTESGLSKRLSEQVTSGSIVGVDSSFRLTTRGETLVRAFRISANIFNTNRQAQ